VSGLLAIIACWQKRRRLERSLSQQGASRSDWVFSAHLLKWSLYGLVLHLTLVLLLQSPFYFSSYDEDLGICFQLLGYKKHLDIHLQSLLKPAKTIFFICHHIRCKPAESKKFSSVLIYRSVPLL